MARGEDPCTFCTFRYGVHQSPAFMNAGSLLGCRLDFAPVPCRMIANVFVDRLDADFKKMAEERSSNTFLGRMKKRVVGKKNKDSGEVLSDRADGKSVAGDILAEKESRAGDDETLAGDDKTLAGDDSEWK